jgi:two-component system sensor histidine kinase RegB
MTDTTFGLFKEQNRSNWIRLRTLVMLRWFAIAGQIVAITVAQQFYNLQLDLGLCYLAVGVSVVGNIIAIFVYPENKRLSEAEAISMLLFDLLQLGFLLFLTGGLHNPFALLILAPVTISATALPARSTLLLGGIALGVATLLSIFHLPLRTQQDAVLAVPDIFLFGSWVAIIIGIVFLGEYARRVTSEIHSMADALLATQMALAREQKLTDLGGVVAAAAHELGTPLATIKLVSAELMDELEDNVALKEDAQLIRDQADRCRDILRSMGRAGKDDLHLKRAPLSTVVREAAEPHMDRGKTIHFDIAPIEGAELQQPTIYRRPEIIHGLRNLVQNAVDFATSEVSIDVNWSETEVMLRIMDDGHGFPTHLIGRIGEPFVRRRKSREDLIRRPEYEGMGLGLFIAKTLLERSGAEITFANGSDPYIQQPKDSRITGAIVEVIWPMHKITEAKSNTEALGENRPFR